MRFEKINNDKIRITLTHEDLIKKDINIHSFMANSVESQDLFFDCLNEAKKQIGFNTENYLLRVETFAMSSGDFILTITRSLPNGYKSISKKKLHIKNNYNSNNQAVYFFSSFDDYCCFVNFINEKKYKINNIADSIWLYEYKNNYYLEFRNLNMAYNDLKIFLYSISEFGSYIKNSDIFARMLSEKANLIMKHNALKFTIKYFKNKSK